MLCFVRHIFATYFYRGEAEAFRFRHFIGAVYIGLRWLTPVYSDR